MGFLEIGTPLSWPDSAEVREYVKQHGLEQLLHVFHANKERRDEELLWGDEVELFLCQISEAKASLALEAANVLDSLEVRERLGASHSGSLRSSWHPEFGNHMIEALPAPAYTFMSLDSLLLVESSMRLRRCKIQAALDEGVYVNSLACFPRMGLDGSLEPHTPASPETSALASRFSPDSIACPHPRFLNLARNTRLRRGAPPCILVPLYEDERTYTGGAGVLESDWTQAVERDQVDRFSVAQLARQTANPVRGFIYMDAFSFGMGQSCVQATLGAHDIDEARHLYDQLAVLAPLFLPLTAATPFARGLLSAYDTRWCTLEQATDCRTVEEEKTIPKSRYSNVSLYISSRPEFLRYREVFNDSRPPINQAAQSFLQERGMDDGLAAHFGHLWVRDPLIIFSDKVHVDDTTSGDHFENLQSTNWNSVRFKPPPATATGGRHEIGWRVEFRTPEVQLTDFENAAVCAVVVVLARMLQRNPDIDLHIPMSLNDVNMRRGWLMDAVTNQKFFFRRDVGSSSAAIEAGWMEMTLAEILGGKTFDEDGEKDGSPAPRPFRGLLNMAMDHVEKEFAAGECSRETVELFKLYSSLFKLRAQGAISTSAQFLRSFIMHHPDYRRDSVVTTLICRDISVLATNIGFGLWVPQELFGELCSHIPRTPLSRRTEVLSLTQLALRSPSFVAFVPPPGTPNKQLPAERILGSHLAALQQGTPSPPEIEDSAYPVSLLPADWPVRCKRCGRQAVFGFYVRAEHPLQDFQQIYDMAPRQILCGASCKQVYPSKAKPAGAAAAAAALAASPSVAAASPPGTPEALGAGETASAVSPPGKPGLEAFPRNESLAMRWLEKYTEEDQGSAAASSCCSHGESDARRMTKQLLHQMQQRRRGSSSTAIGDDLGELIDGFSRCVSLGYQVD